MLSYTRQLFARIVVTLCITGTASLQSELTENPLVQVPDVIDTFFNDFFTACDAALHSPAVHAEITERFRFARYKASTEFWHGFNEDLHILIDKRNQGTTYTHDAHTIAFERIPARANIVTRIILYELDNALSESTVQLLQHAQSGQDIALTSARKEEVALIIAAGNRHLHETLQQLNTECIPARSTEPLAPESAGELARIFTEHIIQTIIGSIQDSFARNLLYSLYNTASLQIL